MPDALAEQFQARRPMLEHVASMLATELTETTRLASFSIRVACRAATTAEFLDNVAASGTSYSNPLAECDFQIVGRIDVNSADAIQPVASKIEEQFTVIATQWVDSAESVERRVRVTCLIPPHMRPDGWAARGDVPAAFTLILQVCATLTTPPHARLVETSTDEGTGLALIMKGGGVKGLAYVGALQVLEEYYHFDWYIGTSAGAIAATLLGAGYSANELSDILSTKNFRDFFDASRLGCIANFAFHHGLHKADAFTNWLDELLAKKLNSHSRVRLSDLPRRVTVYASRRHQAALKFDSEDHDADAAYAVRCSMSIPFVFTPQVDQGIRTFDGGIQNNFPVEALLRDHPDTPFISLFLGAETYEPIVQRWVISDLLSIWTEASDADVIRRFRDQTIVIDPRPIETLDFDLSDDEKAYLIATGRASALGYVQSGSDEHAAAINRRDELKARVEEARQQKGKKRRRAVVVACTIGAIGMFLYFAWPVLAALVRRQLE